MENDQVCYTFDAALEMAITMEEEGFRNYLAAIRLLTNKGAKDLLRENALDELDHKHQLEKALLDGRMDGGDDLGCIAVDVSAGRVQLRQRNSHDAIVRRGR